MRSIASRSAWALSSSPVSQLAARLALLLTLALCAAWCTANPLAAAVPEKVYLTVDEALALAFPGAKLAKETVYLTDEQRARAAKLCGEDVELKIARPYVARVDGKVIGTAYIDVHRVRALKETLLVVVDPEGKVARIEVLAFGEPLEYVPKAEWYAQFTGKVLDDELNLRRSIRGIAGASLSARATTDCVRRVLALHTALLPQPRPEPAPQPLPQPTPEPTPEPKPAPQPVPAPVPAPVPTPAAKKS